MHENSSLQVLNINDVLPNRFQPRLKFDSAPLEQLAESISKFGVIEPIVVRPIGNKYEIVAGERRYKASKLVSKSTIPAIVINLTDKDSEELALLENVQRQALNPIEEAVSYKRILDAGYISREELSRKIGKSQTEVFNKIKLLSLSDEVQNYLLHNRISERHARSLLKLTNLEDQVSMLHRIVNERLTVKMTDREIDNILTGNSKDVFSSSSEPELLFDEKEERGKNTMDIDKIMREAKDINAPVDNNVSSGPNLMENTTPPATLQDNSYGDSAVSLNASTELAPLKSDSQGTNKFVGFNPGAIQNEDVQQNSATNEAPTTVTFDSMFNSPISNQQASNVSESVPTPASGKDISSVVADAFKKYNDENPIPSNDVNASTVQPAGVDTFNDGNQVQNVNNQDSMGSVSTNFNSSVSPTFGDINQSIEPSLGNVVSNLDSNNQNPVPSNINQGVSNTASSTFDSEVQGVSQPINYNTNDASYSGINNTQTDVMNSNMNLNIPDTNIYQSNGTIDNVIPQGTLDVPFPNQPVSTPDVSINNSGVQSVNSQDFAGIVRMLRECADKIEKAGHFVNVDELDLGSKYQVTFTIDK